MLRIVSCIALTFTTVAMAAPVPAGDLPKNITDLPIPADTMLVVQWNGIERSKKRIAESAANEKDRNNLTKYLDDKVNELLAGRDVKGLNRDGRLFLIVYDFSDFRNGDGLALALPIHDYKTFREKFLTTEERKSFEKGKDGIDEIEFENRTMYLVDKKDHVFASRSKATAELVNGKFESMPLAKLGALAEPFMAADVAMYINMELVNLKYSEQIKQVRQFIPLLAQQGGMGINKRQLDQMRVILEGMFQGIEDARGLQVSLDFRPTGVNFRVDLRVKGNTETGKILAEEKPTTLKALGELPKGMSNYSSARSGAGIAKVNRVLDSRLSPADDDEKSKTSIDKFLDLVADPKIEMRSMAHGTQSVQIYSGENATALGEAYLKVMKNLDGGARINNIVLKNRAKVNENAEKLGLMAMHHTLVELDFEATVAEIKDATVREASIAAMKKTAEEKQNVWFGSDGKNFTIVSAANWNDAKKTLELLETTKAKAGDDPAFLAARKQLPDEATYLNLIELNSLAESMATTLQGLNGAIPGFDAPKFEKIQGTKAYLGISLVAKPEYFRFDVFIPSDVIKYFRDSIK